MRLELLEGYPGIAVVQRGYICVAGSSHGSGDQYFIPTDQGDDLPLYQIDHEMGEDPEYILAQGRELIAESLSEFFRTAKVESLKSAW